MISDPDVAEEMRRAWSGVRSLHNKVQRGILGSFAGGSSVILIADIAHNLPFLCSCSVLNDVLLHLRDEGRFQCNKRVKTLGALLSASEDALPWLDLPLIKKCVDRRNDLAHRSVILPRSECWQWIGAVEAQLVAWDVIEATNDVAGGGG